MSSSSPSPSPPAAGRALHCQLRLFGRCCASVAAVAAGDAAFEPRELRRRGGSRRGLAAAVGPGSAALEAAPGPGGERGSASAGGSRGCSAGLGAGRARGESSSVHGGSGTRLAALSSLLALSALCLWPPQGALAQDEDIIDFFPNGSDYSICTNYTENVTNPDDPEGPLIEETIENCTLVKCEKRGCSTHMRREAYLACKALSGFETFTEQVCRSWEGYAETDCNLWCGNCTALGLTIYGQCLFYLGMTLPFSVAFGYCVDLRDTFQLARCPSAGIDKVEWCGPERDFDKCNALCGNYNEAPGVDVDGCDCYRDMSMINQPDVCTGETINTGVIPGTRGLEHSCRLKPRTCMNHYEDTECGIYTYCPVNVCVVKNITCPFVDDCQSAGVCNTYDGKCYYTSRPDGENCTDFLEYTHDDTCFDGYCVGVEDKCMRYDVDCSTDNPCLEPRMLMTYQGVLSNCDTGSGSCMFRNKPEGTSCNSGMGSPFEDDGRCFQGVCRRLIPQPCSVVVPCPNLGDCYEPSVCENYTGVCLPRWKPEGSSCNDGQALTYRDKCIEGRCIGDPFLEPAFQTRGPGDCVEHISPEEAADGSIRPIWRYYKDATEEDTCREQCTYDPECQAFSYGYRVCSIYGTTRNSNPVGGWVLQTTPAYIQHEVECFEKTSGDVWDFIKFVRPYLYATTVTVILVLPLCFTSIWFRSSIRQSRRRMLCETGPNTNRLPPEEETPRSPKGSANIAQGTIYEHPDEHEEAEDPYLGSPYGSSLHGQELAEYEDAHDESQVRARFADNLPGALPGSQESDPRGEVT